MVPTVAVVTTHKKVTVMMAMHLSEHQKDPPEDEVILGRVDMDHLWSAEFIPIVFHCQICFAGVLKL